MSRKDSNDAGLPKRLAKYVDDIHKWASQDRKILDLVALENSKIRELGGLLGEMEEAVISKRSEKYRKALDNKITIVLCDIQYLRVAIHQEFTEKGKS